MSNILRFGRDGYHPLELSATYNTIIDQFIENNPEHATAANTVRDSLADTMKIFTQEGYSTEDIGEVVDSSLSEVLAGVVLKESTSEHTPPHVNVPNQPMGKVIHLADYRPKPSLSPRQ